MSHLGRPKDGLEEKFSLFDLITHLSEVFDAEEGEVRYGLYGEDAGCFQGIYNQEVHVIGEPTIPQ